MNRSLSALTATRFDVLVIGGGILGAAIARDAALRGLAVALVDRGDWGGATSANSLRIVHGGLRYLQSADFARMRASIRERSMWLRVAPHLVEPLPVLVPTRGVFTRSRSALRVAALVNELVSRDRNRGIADDRRLPASRIVSRDECLALAPELAAHRPTGGILFHDGVMYSSERLVLEVVMGAVAAGAVAANHVEATAALRDAGRLAGVVCRDTLTDSPLEIRSRCVVNAAGPSSAAVASALLGAGSLTEPLATQTLAMNLGFDATGHTVAFAIPDASGRQLFVVPWRDRTLIGTAHVPYRGDAASFELPAGEPERFLQTAVHGLPGRTLRADDVRVVQAGLVPGVASPAGHRAIPDRTPQIIDHARDGEPGVFTATSVKFTTARDVAERVVTRVAGRLGSSAPCSTSVAPLPGTPDESVTALLAAARHRHPGVRADVLDHLVRCYGRSHERVLQCASDDPALLDPIAGDSAVVAAQFVYGVREEMACTVDDLVMRRTELGATGRATPAARELASAALQAGVVR